MTSIPHLPEDVRRVIARDVAQGEPPAAMRAQVLRQLEVGLGLSLAPSAAHLNSPVSAIVKSKVGLGLAAKLSLVAALGGSAMLGAWLLQPKSGARIGTPQQSSVTVIAKATPTITTSLAPAPEATPAPSVSASAPSNSAPHAALVDNLAEERRLLASARSALQQHDLTQANALLAEHARRFGSGRLGEERDRLLVQAAVLSGDSARARGQAQSFVRRYPKSVYTPGIARLLDTLK